MEGGTGSSLGSSLLQSATTVAAIAIALAAFTEDTGPTIGSAHVLPLLFIAATLSGVYAAVFAVRAVRQEVRAAAEHRPPDRDISFLYEDAVLYTQLALLIQGVAGLILIVVVSGQ
jgi:hypothetical protein